MIDLAARGVRYCVGPTMYKNSIPLYVETETIFCDTRNIVFRIFNFRTIVLYVTFVK